MNKHAFRGLATAWMTLIVLRAVGTDGGSSRLAQLLGDVDRIVQRALDADVPAIPDRRGGGDFGTAPTVARLPTAPAAPPAAAAPHLQFT